MKQVFKNALEITEDDQLVSDIKQKAPLLYAFQTGQNGICEWHKEFEYPEKRASPFFTACIRFTREI